VPGATVMVRVMRSMENSSEVGRFGKVSVTLRFLLDEL
jgi:hypothetical protein